MVGDDGGLGVIVTITAANIITSGVHNKSTDFGVQPEWV